VVGVEIVFEELGRWRAAEGVVERNEVIGGY